MKKILLTMLAACFCTADIMAQEEDDNALRISFRGTGNPVETEHMLEGMHITFSEDGEQMNLSVNDATVTYALDNVSGMSHFCGTPSVSLRANQDPDNLGNWYTTFYSGLEAYTLPEGVKAYTAVVSGDVIKLTAIDGDVLPQGEAVLLYSTQTSDMTMEVADPTLTQKSNDNQFQGVDVQTEQDGDATCYMFSYGQYKLGFYKMNPSMLLAANKAFIRQMAVSVNALRLLFADDADGIEEVGEQRVEWTTVYNLSGQRLDGLRRGVNVVNGKKMIVK